MMVTSERSDDADGDPLLQLHPRPQEAHNGLRADIFIIFITIASNIIHRKENIFEKLFLWFCHLVRRHQPPIFLLLRHCIFTV